MPFLRAIHRQSYYGKDVQNIYTYKTGDDAPLTADDILLFNAGFDLNVLTTLRPLQITGLTYVELDSFDIENPDTVRNVYPLSGGGSATGTGLPAYFTYYISQNVPQRLTRPGRKAISGVPESAYLNETTLEGGFPGLMTAFLTDVGNAFNTTGRTWLPVVVRTTRPDPDLPEVVDRYQEITNAVFRRFSTQNSRKIGRGS